MTYDYNYASEQCFEKIYLRPKCSHANKHQWRRVESHRALHWEAIL